MINKNRLTLWGFICTQRKAQGDGHQRAHTAGWVVGSICVGSESDIIDTPAGHGTLQYMDDDHYIPIKGSQMTTYIFREVVEPDGDGWHAYCPALLQ